MEKIDTLNFNKNYNNKFCCNVFTTLRPCKPSRKPGDILGVKLKLDNGTILREKVQIKHKMTAKLKDIPECVFAVDTGMSKSLSIKLIQELYEPYGVDVFAIDFDILVLTHYYD